MSRVHRMLEKAAEEMDLTGQPAPGQPIVEIAGDRRVLIENHFGITQYSAEKICVNVKFGQISICGCNLELDQMNREQLIITGRIDIVGIHRRQGK